jgi:2-dehydropantoate 2-reductase
MKHAILGAGAVSGLVGAVLAREGEDVRLLVRPENQSGYPGKLKLNTPNGAMESPVRIETKLTDDVDVLWVAVKTYQLIGALRAVPSESNVGTIIPLLNGIDHIDLLRVRFGHDNVVPATIAVEVERIAAGQVVQRSQFSRRRSQYSDKKDWRMSRIGFGMAVLIVNFKLTRKPCCGASWRSWDRLR